MSVFVFFIPKVPEESRTYRTLPALHGVTTSLGARVLAWTAVRAMKMEATGFDTRHVRPLSRVRKPGEALKITTSLEAAPNPV